MEIIYIYILYMSLSITYIYVTNSEILLHSITFVHNNWAYSGGGWVWVKPHDNKLTNA